MTSTSSSKVNHVLQNWLRDAAGPVLELRGLSHLLGSPKRLLLLWNARERLPDLVPRTHSGNRHLPIVVTGVPNHAEVCAEGVGHFLHNPEDSSLDRVYYE